MTGFPRILYDTAIETGETELKRHDNPPGVLRALNTMAAFADFATVSGECDNPTRPEAVYRACGFVGDDVWHILR